LLLIYVVNVEVGFFFCTKIDGLDKIAINVGQEKIKHSESDKRFFFVFLMEP